MQQALIALDWLAKCLALALADAATLATTAQSFQHSMFLAVAATYAAMPASMSQGIAPAGREAAPALQQLAQNATMDAACFDEEAGCPAWAEGDGCIQTGPAFMLEKCRRSCGVCGIPYIQRTADKVPLATPVTTPFRVLQCSNMESACAILALLADAHREHIACLQVMSSSIRSSTHLE